MVSEPQIWLFLAIPKPDANLARLGFKPPKPGKKAWFKTLKTRETAITTKHQIKNLVAWFKCIKADKTKTKPYKPRTDGVYSAHAKHFKPPRKFKPWDQPKRHESKYLRRHRDAEFQLYQQEMARPPPPAQTLPEPKNGPSFGTLPGLSKSGKPAKHI